MYKVIYKRKVEKMLAKMPLVEQQAFYVLKDDLVQKGSVQNEWPNYSKLGKSAYHCHLSRKWVACWKELVKGKELEVAYVGTRRNAPY